MRLVKNKAWKKVWKPLWWLNGYPDYFHIECLLFAYSWYSDSYPLRHLIFTPWTVYEWRQD